MDTKENADTTTMLAEDDQLLEDQVRAVLLDNSPKWMNGTIGKRSSMTKFKRRKDDESDKNDSWSDSDGLEIRAMSLSTLSSSEESFKSQEDAQFNDPHSLIEEIDKRKPELNEGRQETTSENLTQLVENARFFIIKSNNMENIKLSKSNGVWSTLKNNVRKLNRAYKECRNVILVFSAARSGEFSGFARMASESQRWDHEVNWVLLPGYPASEYLLKYGFKIDWISKIDLPFAKANHLYNPYNDGKLVKIGRDGQEIERRVGAALCHLFPEDNTVDWNVILVKTKLEKERISKIKTDEKQKRCNHSRSFENDFPPFSRQGPRYSTRMQQPIFPMPVMGERSGFSFYFDYNALASHTSQRTTARCSRRINELPPRFRRTPPQPPFPFPPPYPFDSIPPPPPLHYYNSRSPKPVGEYRMLKERSSLSGRESSLRDRKRSGYRK